MSAHTMELGKSYQPGGYCPGCDYPTEVGICAECGRSNTFVVALSREARRRRWLILLRYGAVALALLTGLVFGGRMAVYRWLPDGILELMDDEWIGFAPDLAGRIRRFRNARQAEYVRGIISRLEAEAAGISAGHPWAGIYEAGPSSGARQRYDELHLGMAGDAIYARCYYGRVTATDQFVDCVFESPWNYSQRWIRCAVGDQVALVAEQDIYLFLNAPDDGQLPPLSILYRGGAPERHGRDFRWPAVRTPAEYERFRLPGPLNARVIAVRDVTARISSHQHLQLQLDVGSRDGVFEGLPFWCASREFAVAVGTARAEAVSAETCWARVSVWHDPARPAHLNPMGELLISGRAEPP